MWMGLFRLIQENQHHRVSGGELLLTYYEVLYLLAY